MMALSSTGLLAAMLPRRFLLALPILIAGLFPAAASAQLGLGAAKFINDLAQQAIQTLQAQGQPIEAREQRFRALLEDGFALPMIGRFVLGQSYRQLTPDEQQEYQQLFASYVLRTYSYRLGGYKGEAFTVVSAQVQGEQDVLVRTRIERPGGAAVQCDWRVRVFDGRYKIVDVLVEGISMAVTQRSEFAAVVQNNGTAGLLEALRARVARYPAKGSTG
ncbi:MAG: ABC transporter substrate-binding protein [Alphaproteobacteria bacterium]|nr:ABC transporter substrate-binding protein [Alphaproteobacteria bacterium]